VDRKGHFASQRVPGYTRLIPILFYKYMKYNPLNPLVGWRPALVKGWRKWVFLKPDPLVIHLIYFSEPCCWAILKTQDPEAGCPRAWGGDVCGIFGSFSRSPSLYPSKSCRAFYRL